MEQRPYSDPGTDTTQDARITPQPRGSGAEAAAPQTTADTEPHCAIDLDALQDDISEQQRGLEATRVERLRRVGAKLSEFFKDY